MTRVGDWPKYGAYDRDYAGTEHDGFPDTFTVETTAMLDWGLIERAGRYIDNYFGKFVRDDGTLLYRGPETGQFGRMRAIAIAWPATVSALPASRILWSGCTSIASPKSRRLPPASNATSALPELAHVVSSCPSGVSFAMPMVAGYLKEKGIDSARLVVLWYGLTNPVVPNTSPENMYLRIGDALLKGSIGFDAPGKHGPGLLPEVRCTVPAQP